ncbi:MEDS domain-containing protein [Actinoplanes sp. NPDC048796]|uniref:MEDS domain-containing protein n=1 Tax=Actinoplanes sp. NPDC048796 TaxID=3155640 RepID=UPI0033C209E5
MRPAPKAGHECWSYEDQGLFDAYARRCVDQALAAGERVWFVPSQHADVTGLPGGDAVRVIRFAEAYATHEVVDPARQVAAYAAATEDALAAGFTGFRVVADVTPLVRTDEQRDAFARYEYVIGRYMRHHPMSAVCAYNRGELGERAVAELACLHESSHAAGVSFQLHPGATSAEAVLEGELDLSAEDLFATALRRTDLDRADGEVVVDATGLRFIDHRALLALQRYAESQRTTAVLRTPLGAVARLAGLLDLPHVRVEAAR